MAIAIQQEVRRVGELPPRPTSAEELLMTRYTANELRRWCAENSITRNRGDNKLETARKAIRQAPERVLEELGETLKERNSFQQPDDEYNYLREEAFSRDADGWIILYRGKDPHSDKPYLVAGFF